jgi:hypothetical protein
MPSLLDFSSLQPNYHAEEKAARIERNFDRAGQFIGAAIEGQAERGREREKKFESMFDLDTSKVADLESKKYVIDKYSRLKNDYINRFRSNKDWLGYGKLPPDQRIQLRSDLDSLAAEAAMLSNLDKALIEGESIALSKDNMGVYKVDDKLKAEWSEAKRTGDAKKMAEVVVKINQSPAGKAFLTYQQVNPDLFIMNYIQSARKLLNGKEIINKNEYLKNGNVVDATKTSVFYGDEKSAKDALYVTMTGGVGGKQAEFSLVNSLSDEEKAQALSLYPTEEYPLLRYYIDSKADVSSIVKGNVRKSTSTSPYEPKESSSRGKVRLGRGGDDEDVDGFTTPQRHATFEGKTYKTAYLFQGTGTNERTDVISKPIRLSNGEEMPVNSEKVGQFRITAYDLDTDKIIVSESGGGTREPRVFEVNRSGNEKILQSVLMKDDYDAIVDYHKNKSHLSAPDKQKPKVDPPFKVPYLKSSTGNEESIEFDNVVYDVDGKNYTQEELVNAYKNKYGDKYSKEEIKEKIKSKYGNGKKR